MRALPCHLQLRSGEQLFGDGREIQDGLLGACREPGLTASPTTQTPLRAPLLRAATSRHWRRMSPLPGRGLAPQAAAQSPNFLIVSKA